MHRFRVHDPRQCLHGFSTRDEAFAAATALAFRERNTEFTVREGRRFACSIKVDA